VFSVLSFLISWVENMKIVLWVSMATVVKCASSPHTHKSGNGHFAATDERASGGGGEPALDFSPPNFQWKSDLSSGHSVGPFDEMVRFKVAAVLLAEMGSTGLPKYEAFFDCLTRSSTSVTEVILLDHTSTFHSLASPSLGVFCDFIPPLVYTHEYVLHA
jgi:hypothetical protein